LTLDTGGRSFHLALDARSVAGHLRDREGRAGARRPRRELGEILAVRVLDDDRQHFADRRAAPAAFGKRPPAAEHQQPAAALVDEVGEHAQLLGREGGGFDAAEDDRAVREQLLARLREAAEQLVLVADVAAPVLVLGGPQQDRDLQVLVVLDRPPDELHLDPGLAFEVEDLFTPIV
jgi:hypothetical protein